MRILIGYTNQIVEVKARRPLPGRAHVHDEILAFGNGYTHLNVTPEMDWQNILTLCPSGWRPDVYIHWSPEYNPIPEGLERADCLTVGVFGDWNLGGRAMRIAGGLFDVVAADKVGCERLQSMGYTNVIHSLLWAFDPLKHRCLGNPKNQVRDIDVLMIGNFNHAIQWKRAPWLARVARMSHRYRVVLTSGLYGSAYVQAMNRAKIVFNRSIRGEANMRAFEAPACGALMFYEAENREIQEIYTDREHCVLYEDTTLESLLAYYLDPNNVEERERIAEQGRQRVQQHSYAHHLAGFLDHLEPLLSCRTRRINGFTEAVERKTVYATQWLLSCRSQTHARIATMLSDTMSDTRPPAPDDRPTASGDRPAVPGDGPAILNLHAVLWGEMAQCTLPGDIKHQNLQSALRYAEQAVQQAPHFLIARFNLAYLLQAAENHSRAESLLQQLARDLNAMEQAGETAQAPDPQQSFRQILGPTFPRRFHWLDVAIEWAYGQYGPGSQELRHAVQAILRCQIHLTLFEIAYARGEYAQSTRYAAVAAAAMPTLGEAHYALACSLRAAGRTDDSLAAYRQTVVLLPFYMTAYEELIRLCLDISVQTKRWTMRSAGLNCWMGVRTTQITGLPPSLCWVRHNRRWPLPQRRKPLPRLPPVCLE